MASLRRASGSYSCWASCGSGGDSQRWFAFAGGVLAILAASIVFLDFQRILEIDPAAGFYAATDYGIYITLAGALLALLGCLFKRIPGSAQRVVTAVSTMLWR
jgi:hypothetical protein